MLDRLHIKNLTVFPEADLRLGRNLNVIIGENGTGKTHLLKALYSAMAVSAEAGKKHADSPPTKSFLQGRLADKLVNVFRPETLGRLARRRQGRERCDISLAFDNAFQDLAFSFATNSKSEVSVDNLPAQWLESTPVYVPTRELLTIYPNFISVYEGHYLEFEETWRDTCLLLGAPSVRGPQGADIREMLQHLEPAMGGSIDLDKNGRFYLRPFGSTAQLEMPLVAEGHRKLGMLARLIATGALGSGGGYLFWDEPEANLNPRLIKSVANLICVLSAWGIQTIIATHSLFLLREIEILRNGYPNDMDIQFFGLHQSGDGVEVQQGSSVDDIGEIASLNEELEQSDRYLEKVP